MPDLGWNALSIQSTEHVQVAGVAPTGLKGEQVGSANTIQSGADRVLNESRLSEEGEVRQAQACSERYHHSLVMDKPKPVVK